MHLLKIFLPLAILAMPLSAQAEPPQKLTKTLEDVLSKSSKSTASKPDGLSLKDNLPSSEQIEAMIDDLPNFNHLMDGLFEIAQDDKIREQIAESADHMQRQLKDSGALEPRSNGLPDFNAGIELMLRSLSDEKGLGGILSAMELAGDDLKTVMEDSFDGKDKGDGKDKS